jgi:hypothetical protein
MSARPDSNLSNALIVTRTVETGQAVAVGRVVKDGNADKECQHTTDGVKAIGVIVALGKDAGAAGDKVQMAYLAGACIIPVKVGTGGATRGYFAKVVSDGVTDATETVTTPAAMDVVGFFTQSGVAGDLVGMVPARSWLTE